MRREHDEGEASRSGQSGQSAWNQTLVEIAGGFSHDANNCLTGIFSMSDLCLAQVLPDSPLHEPLSLIRESANQASQLLQRLSRLLYDQPGTSDYHNLNDVTAEVADVLRRVLPRNLELAVRPSEKSLPVYTDIVELRRSCLYLVLGAAAGLSGQGQIVLETDAKMATLAPPDGATVSLTAHVSGYGFTPKKFAAIEQTSGSHDVLALRLGLVRSFAEKYGGTFTLARPEDDNVSLILRLPRAAID